MFRVGITSSGTGTGDIPDFRPNHSGVLEIRPSISTTATTLGLSITVSSDVDRQAVLSIPRLSISHTETKPGPGTISAYVEFENLQVHVIKVANNPAWRLDWTAVKFYVDGAVVASWSGGTTQQSIPELYFTPSSILIFGGMPTISSSCGYFTSGYPAAPYDVLADVTGQAFGGYWFEENAGDGLTESPVVLQSVVSPEYSGYADTFDPAGIVTGSLSGSITCRSGVYFREIRTLTTSISDIGSLELWDEAFDSSATILANIPHEFRRFDPEWYRQIIARFGFPETRAEATATRSTITITGGLVGTPVLDDTATADEVLTQSYSDMLRIVGSAVDASLEGPLSDTCYAPITIESTKTYYKWFDNVVVVPFPPFYLASPGDGSGYQVTYSLGSSCETGIENPAIYYKHSNARVRWWDNLGNKLFVSFYPWRPPNNGSGSTQWRPVEGIDVYTYDDTTASPAEVGYWDNVFSAYCKHSSIASDLHLKTRPILRSQGLSLQPFAFEWPYTTPIKPLGICRFSARAIEPATEKTMTSASEPLWAGTDCLLSFGSAITVNPVASPFTVELDLGSWDQELYQFPHIAKLVLIQHTCPGTMQAYAVGADGSETLLDAADKKLFIPGPATQYAGTWAKDHSADTAVVDNGADADANGVSIATLGDAERYTAFQLLPGRGPQKIELRFTDATLAEFTIDYPTFFTEPEFKVVPLDHQQTALLWRQGPAVIFGPLEWFDFDDVPPTELTTPVVAPWARTRPTVFSYLKWENTVLLGEESTLNVDGLLQDLFTTVEGQDRLDAAIDSVAVIVRDSQKAPYAILHNEYQVGPLGLFPFRKVNASGFAQSETEYVCEVWDAAIEPKFYVNVTEPVLYGGSKISSVDTSASLPGWVVSRQAEPMENDEASDFEIRVAGVAKGVDLSPWFGYFLVASGTGGQVSQDVAASARHVIAKVQDGTICLAFLGNRPEEVPAFVDTGIAAERVCARYLRGGTTLTLRIWYSQSGVIKQQDTTDEGASFSMPITLGNGTDVTAHVAAQGFIWQFRVDSGAVKLRMFNANGSAIGAGPFSSDITVVASGADSTGIAASATSVGSTFTLFLSYYASGVLTRLSSTDSGLTWS